MPSIKYFQVAGKVLEANVTSIMQRQNRTRKNVCDQVVSYLQTNSAQWTSGQQPSINYLDPLCRIAYLYGIVPANANLIQHVFEVEQELADFILARQTANGQVGVCAFGGGPGNELLGMVKWIETKQFDQQIVLEFLLLDRVREWIDSWQAIQRQVLSHFRTSYGTNRAKWPLVISGSFSSVDITDTSSFANLGNLFGQDIYILSYVVSEIFDQAVQLREFAAEMAKHAPRGSKFVFIDRNEERWKDEVRTLASEMHIDLADFRAELGTMDPYTEDKIDLGQIFADVGRNPRVSWNAFWVVGTKP